MKADRSLTTLLAGITIALASAAVRADVTAQWTSIAAHTVRHAAEEPAKAERVLRAVREAVQAAAGRSAANGSGNGGSATEAQRRDAAVAVAAFAVLEILYPAHRESLEAQLAVTFSHIPESDAKAEGAALGRRIANDVVRGIADR